MSDTDAEVRQGAARALGLLGGTSALEALAETLLHDSESEVRSVAAWALGNTKAPEALDPLITALREGGSNVDPSIVRALRALGDARAVEPLCAVVQEAGIERMSDCLRRSIVDALATLRDPRAYETLCSFLESEQCNDHTRGAAAHALAAIGDRRAFTPLLALLHSTSPTIRWAVVSSLGQLGDLRAIEPLLSLQHDEDAWLRYLVAQALGGMDDPRVIAPLHEMLHDPTANVTCAAISALQQRGALTVNMLLPLLHSPFGTVCTQAVRALGVLGDRRASEALLALLEAEQWVWQRRVIVAALSALGETRAIPAIRTQLLGLRAKSWREGFSIALEHLEALQAEEASTSTATTQQEQSSPARLSA